MSIGFQWTGESPKDEPSCVLDDRTIELLDPAWAYLADKTGIWIDPYGHSRISPAHAQLLLDGIHDRVMLGLEGDDAERVAEFRALLNECVREQRSLYAEGD